MLKSKKEELNSEVEEKEELIKKYEWKLRNNVEKINRKQHLVDKLNRRYADLTKDVKEESTGPLEAEIYNMEKSNKEFEDKIEILSKDWGKK